MTHFRCGCPLDPQNLDQRCDEHRSWLCHDLTYAVLTVRHCPPCYRARLLSVNISPSATPTRKKP